MGLNGEGKKILRLTAGRSFAFKPTDKVREGLIALRLVLRKHQRTVGPDRDRSYGGKAIPLHGVCVLRAIALHRFGGHVRASLVSKVAAVAVPVTVQP